MESGRLCDIAICALCIITFSPSLSREFARDCTTAMAGLIIYLCDLVPSRRTHSFLNIPLTALVYLGDISYSLYLIHWPVVVLVRYWTFDVLNFKCKFSLTTCLKLLSRQCSDYIAQFSWGRGHLFISFAGRSDAPPPRKAANKFVQRHNFHHKYCPHILHAHCTFALLQSAT